MEKTYLTSKSKDELSNQINYLKSNYKSKCKEKELFTIRFVNGNEIRVDIGRTMTYWRYDFNNSGEFVVKKRISFNEIFLLISFILIDMVFALLVLHKNITINGIGFLLVLFVLEWFPSYHLYVLSPLKTIDIFCKKYLDAN